MERRTELIVRLPDLTAEQAAAIERVLAPQVKRLGGRMSAVVRDHADDYSLHVSRRRIV